jgi:ABC-type phosphate transport system substrate-binding protein
MRQLARLLLLLAACLTCATVALADVVVVVDAQAGVDRLTQDEVINIFLGRYRRLPNGVAAVPVDQPVAGEIRDAFYQKLVGKGQAEINAYWARLIFSGKTSPPVQALSAADVPARIVGTEGGVGYVERNQVDARLKVVFTFPP